MPTILLVDDDPTFLKILGRQLGALGHEVVTRADGLEAFRALAESPGTYDLLITDLIMPQMTGAELIDHLRADPNHRNLPVVLVSATSDAGNLGSLLQDEKVRFLAKPVDFFTVSSAISRLLNRSVSECIGLTPEQEEMLRQARPRS